MAEKKESFDCCNLNVLCSNALQCIHERKENVDCSYRFHLERGRVFYGKNANISIQKIYKFKINEISFQAIYAIARIENGGGENNRQYLLMYYILVKGKYKPIAVLKTRKTLERGRIIKALSNLLNAPEK